MQAWRSLVEQEENRQETKKTGIFQVIACFDYQLALTPRLIIL